MTYIFHFLERERGREERERIGPKGLHKISKAKAYHSLLLHLCWAYTNNHINFFFPSIIYIYIYIYIYIVFKTRLKSPIPLLLGETHVIFISFKNKYNIHPFRSSLVQYNSLLHFCSIMSNLVQFNWIHSILIHSVDFTLIYSGWVNTKSLFEIRLFC